MKLSKQKQTQHLLRLGGMIWWGRDIERANKQCGISKAKANPKRKKNNHHNKIIQCKTECQREREINLILIAHIIVE